MGVNVSVTQLVGGIRNQPNLCMCIRIHSNDQFVVLVHAYVG